MASALQCNASCRLNSSRTVTRQSASSLRNVQVGRSSRQAISKRLKCLPVEKSSSSFDAVKDIDEIMKILPHRFPFLLVDRVVEVEAGKSIVGYKNVTVNDNFFTGHFPDRPIMPGVLQIEALAQLGGILMLEGKDEAARGNFFFGGVNNCRFRKPVVPGDTLMMKVEITKFKEKLGICKAHGMSYVGEDLVCDTDMTLVLGKE